MNTDQNKIETELIRISRDFLGELQAERALQAISLDASLERDLGIDSLGKVELFHRIEKKFSIKLPEMAMIEVNSLRDLAKIIIQKTPEQAFEPESGLYSKGLESLSIDLSSLTTLTDVLSSHATNVPKRPHIYLQNETGEEQIITYKQLFNEATDIARGLYQRGIEQGETIAIMLPTSAEFFYSFIGILMIGAIPVPIYPPFRLDQIEEYAKRQAKTLNNAEARILITFSRAEALSGILKSFIPSLIEVTTANNLKTSSIDSLPALSIKNNMPALIQYTSGSTGDPKGVLLSHQNILTNIRAIEQTIGIKPNDVAVSWLPLYHDMGLLIWLGSLYFGIPITILSPLTFLSRPEKWLWTIHYHRGTFSGGPNFAYDLCTDKIEPSDIEGLDLSSWSYAFSGSEAVNPKTLKRFTEKFSSYGFKHDSLLPAYGLAESTVALTIPTQRQLPYIDRIQRDYFEKESKAVPTTASDKTALEFVSCGKVLSGHEIRIVDEKGNKLDERHIGELLFKGPSSMQGYFNNPKATQKAYHDGWWDTGDLGYIANNELFITGRKKDLIIKAGRNLYPDEIEDVIGQVNHIIKGGVVAFGIQDPKTGTEKLIAVAETDQSDKKIQQSIRSEIIQKTSTSLGISPDTIIFVPPLTVPKTASGKLQRSSCKQAYLSGQLTTKQSSIKIQFIKLKFISTLKKIKRWFSFLGKFAFTLYVGILLLVTIPFLWICTFVVSRQLFAKLIRSWSRNIFRMAMCPITVEGTNNLKSNQPMICVTNHTSYTDALLLLATLPPGVTFTPKKELLKAPFIGTFIKKLGFITIDRTDFNKSLEDVNYIKEAILRGQSIAIFPEGTFTYATGLRPFKLGAFSLAVETQTPICPISIQGTRSILRGDDLLLRRGAIKVIIGELIFPHGKDWNETTRLLSLTRAEIAKHCGEPIIDIMVAGPEKDW